jgi:hypothetical protein
LHGFFAVFPGISLENPVFACFFGSGRSENRELRAFEMVSASRIPDAVQSSPRALAEQ